MKTKTLHSVYLPVLAAALSCAAFAQQDPGVRPGPTNAGNPVRGLAPAEAAAFFDGKAAFQEVDGVDEGLGLRFNLDSCGGCHANPAFGGSSPEINPQIAAATRNGARNIIPPFLRVDGPVRVVRYRRNPDGSRDGGVHALFTVAGRSDTPAGCNVPQEDFSNAGNLTFRIPTPLFGLGLIEAIPDSVLMQNLRSNGVQKRQFGIRGRLNVNGNDGTVTRFGWKAQNKSLAIFAGEAYHVESGVTNELFPNERTEHPTCPPGATPEDQVDYVNGKPSDVTRFTTFMRFLDTPVPAPRNHSAANGEQIFGQIGCALCHTPALATARSSVAALSNQTVRPYSDLALHDMGPGLADDIVQGIAGPQEFRTAPLWGLGKRNFFLHDGRTRDLMQAIDLHSSPGSEASAVVAAFRGLAVQQKQDLLNFLRSL